MEAWNMYFLVHVEPFRMSGEVDEGIFFWRKCSSVCLCLVGAGGVCSVKGLAGVFSTPADPHYVYIVNETASEGIPVLEHLEQYYRKEQ